MVTYTVTYPNKSQQYSKNFNFVHQVIIGGSWFEVIPLVPVGVQSDYVARDNTDLTMTTSFMTCGVVFQIAMTGHQSKPMGLHCNDTTRGYPNITGIPHMHNESY